MGNADQRGRDGTWATQYGRSLGRTHPLLDTTSWVGVLTAMTLLSSIGDIPRFPLAKHLVGYARLGASIGEHPRVGASASRRTDHQAGPTRTAHRHDRRGLGSR